jgi:hypothetical protein
MAVEHPAGTNPSACHRERSSRPGATEEVDHAPKVKAGEYRPSTQDPQERGIRRCGRVGCLLSTGKTQVGQGFSRVCHGPSGVIPVFGPSHSFRELNPFFALRARAGLTSGPMTTPANFDIVRRGFVTCPHSPSNPFFCHEEDLPTQGSKAKAPTRLPSSHADPGRPQHRQSAPSQRSEASRCLTSNPFAPPGISGGC